MVKEIYGHSQNGNAVGMDIISDFQFIIWMEENYKLVNQ